MIQQEARILLLQIISCLDLEKKIDVDDKDDEGWDVDYIVNRPEVEEDEEECKWNCVDDCHWNCERPDEDLTPYKKYKSYKRWEKRPLFVIIIGG